MKLVQWHLFVCLLIQDYWCVPVVQFAVFIAAESHESLVQDVL